MRKAVLFSVIISLLCSVVAPYGAVFASPDTNETESTEPAPASDPVAPEEPLPASSPVETHTSPAEATTPQVVAMPSAPAAAAALPQAVATQPSPVVPTGPVVVSAFQFRQGEGFDFVEFRNIDDTYIDVSELSVHLLYSSATTDYECIIEPTGYMRPNSYVTYVQPTLATTHPGAYTMSGCPQPSAGSLFDKEIQVYQGNQLVESVRIAESDMNGKSVQEWERKGFTTTYFKGVLSDDFKASTRAAYTSGFYEPPQAPALQFLEIFPHPLLCNSADVLATCRPYIKVKNIGSAAIDLSQFRLRNGATTAKSSSYNTSSLTGTIVPGTFATIGGDASGNLLAMNDEDGATWLEDQHGVRTYSNNDPPYKDAELAAQLGRSWAYDSSTGTWRWAIPSPQSEQNIFPSNDEAGKGAAGDGLKPCRDDQYRSEETNRCRSIASAAASVLKPCADDQFRNPTTNRCKKIASADDASDCGEGRERNPVTNRCRNVVSSDVPAAAFAVEPIKDSATAFVGWWAFGGIAATALGYAGWEWRREIISAMHQAGMLFRGKR